MKTKKKLLIGTAIMALAAGGASAVSTMAWFQASVNSTISANAAADLSKVTVSQSTISDQNLKFDINLAQTASQKVVLTDDNGVTKGYNNGGVLTATVPAGSTAVGTYEISVSWHSGVTEAQQKAAYGASVKLTVTTPAAASNPANALKLVGSNDATDIEGTYKYEVNVSVASDGSLQLSKPTGSDQKLTVANNVASGYFVCRALEESGLEGYANAGVYAVDHEGGYVFGDVVSKTVETTTTYYICNVATVAKDEAWSDAKWYNAGTTKPTTHDNDQIHVA